MARSCDSWRSPWLGLQMENIHWKNAIWHRKNAASKILFFMWKYIYIENIVNHSFCQKLVFSYYSPSLRYVSRSKILSNITLVTTFYFLHRCTPILSSAIIIPNWRVEEKKQIYPYMSLHPTITVYLKGVDLKHTTSFCKINLRIF